MAGAVLGHDTLGQRLLTFQLYDQQANVPLGIIPLLQVDMWEHASYLQYKNVKADYVKAFWNVVNWADVQDRFASAISKTNGLTFWSDSAALLGTKGGRFCRTFRTECRRGP